MIGSASGMRPPLSRKRTNGTASAVFAAGSRNTDVSDAPFPLWSVAAVVIVGLVVPLLTALGPVRRGARITVREALSDDPPPPRVPNVLERRFERKARQPRPLMLTLR